VEEVVQAEPLAGLAKDTTRILEARVAAVEILELVEVQAPLHFITQIMELVQAHLDLVELAAQDK
jgi:hypothetical protein